MDLSPLNLLLTATTKVAVDQAIVFVYLTRNQPFSDFIQKFKELLCLSQDPTSDELMKLREALLECISYPLSSGNLEDLAVLFEERGSTINPKLQQLIGQVIKAHLDSWKDASALNRISLPRLQDFDWSLNFQRASSQLADIQIPSILMSLTVEDVASNTSMIPDSKQIQFELSREALETMIDGLGKIRDQLASMK